MDEKTSHTDKAEYEVCGTKYTVTPVYKSEAQKEALEDKIRRLILTDKQGKA